MRLINYFLSVCRYEETSPEDAKEESETEKKDQ